MGDHNRNATILRMVLAESRPDLTSAFLEPADFSMVVRFGKARITPSDLVGLDEAQIHRYAANLIAAQRTP